MTAAGVLTSSWLRTPDPDAPLPNTPATPDAPAPGTPAGSSSKTMTMRDLTRPPDQRTGALHLTRCLERAPVRKWRDADRGVQMLSQ
ncbi:hypothetical protein GCM10009646_32770 [Streptomyces aureus]